MLSIRTHRKQLQGEVKVNIRIKPDGTWDWQLNSSIGDIADFKIVMESIGEHMTATVVMNGKAQARGVPVITKEWYESQHGELK